MPNVGKYTSPIYRIGFKKKVNTNPNLFRSLLLPTGQLHSRKLYGNPERKFFELITGHSSQANLVYYDKNIYICMVGIILNQLKKNN